MRFLASLADDWRNWLLVGLAVAAFVWVSVDRMAFDEACAGSKDESLKIPEARLTYDAFDLAAFVNAVAAFKVNGHPALRFYIDRTLRRSDIWFAVALSLLTAAFWLEVAVSPDVYVWLNWAALPLGALAIVYGVADVAEDLKLAKILDHAPIDPADAAATNALTRIKMVSLTLSLVGALIFLVIHVCQLIAAALRRKEQTPVPT